MKKLLPILLALIGLGAGIGGGMALRPPPAEPGLDNPCGEVAPIAHAEPEPEEETVATTEFVKLNNQFVIPDVDNGRVTAMVVMSLSLEVPIGARERIYQMEPKLRDAFLQVLFDHANAGGFKGTFTDGTNMTNLRKALKEIAVSKAGNDVKDILIMDIVRQDMN